jgi:fucose permease
VLILPRITTPAKTLTAPQLHQAQGKDLSFVVGPYLGIAVVLVLMGLFMAARTALSEGLYLAARSCERKREPLSSIAKGVGDVRPEETRSQPLLGSGMVVLFIALICCFTAWGIAQDLTTPMVAGFKRIFAMSTFQASLVQLAYFGAYFMLALPAAFINQRFGYKTS